VWPYLVAAGVLELVARLALPVALIALARAESSWAVMAAVATSVCSAARAEAIARASDEAHLDVWGEVIASTRSRSVIELRMRKEDEESVATLIGAMYERVRYLTQLLPTSVVRLLGLIVLAVYVAWRLGVAWLLFGVAATLPLAALVYFLGRRSRVASTHSWKLYAAMTGNLRVLLEAGAELRANGRERELNERLDSEVIAYAAAERVSRRWQALLGLLPLSLAVLAVAGPSRADVTWMTDSLGGLGVVEVMVVGAAAAVFATGLASNVQLIMVGQPQRAALALYLSEARASAARVTRGGTALDHGELLSADIHFDDVSFVYPGASTRTPNGFARVWKGGTSLALAGANGAGKSTLSLIVMGLLDATEGSVRVGEHELQAIDARSLHQLSCVVPQAPFSLLGSSVRWHLELWCGDAFDDTEALDALQRVGMRDILEAHARRAKISALDVPVGELSGGERQRMHLARILLKRAALVVVDEPEVFIDADGRALLRDLLEELSRDCRILLIAHDEGVIPASFDRARCEAS
jgi:ABC-type multidrug transport system fused ATPase/permease subunit